MADSGRLTAAQRRFVAALSEAHAAALSQVTGAAVAMMTDALNTLTGVMSDGGAPVGARGGAARAVLDNALRFTEAVTLAERVARLEEHTAGGGATPGGVVDGAEPFAAR